MSKQIRHAAGAIGICAALALPAPVALSHPEGEPWGTAETTLRQVVDVAQGESVSVDVDGAGFFHAVEVVKTGGASDQTMVVVALDGRPSMDYSFATLSSPLRWLSTADMIANVRKAGDTGTMTLWFRSPIEYRSSLKVAVHVGEQGVSRLNVRVLHGRLDEAADHDGQEH